MPSLLIPSDAFSHGQIKSKLWLSENFNLKYKKYLSSDSRYTLNWYGSWVGIGPLLLLSQNLFFFNCVNLFDINTIDLENSKSVLDFWRCESIEINLHNVDVNSYLPSPKSNQLFINTSCEHLNDINWLMQIPSGAHVILQSTNMPHDEHINSPNDLNHFIEMYSNLISIIDSQSLEFVYPNKKFDRYMLFGIKK